MWLSADLVSDHGQSTVRERENLHDRYSVAVLEADTCCVVGHFFVPRLISHECYFFLRSGGTITAEVSERRRCSDLPDGGLDILTLCHKEKIIDQQSYY